MKRIVLLCIVVLSLWACEKEDEVTPANTLSQDLQEVVAQEGISRMRYCKAGLSCDQANPFRFKGAHFVEIGLNTYNLKHLESYRVVEEEPYGNVMLLRFQ